MFTHRILALAASLILASALAGTRVGAASAASSTSAGTRYLVELSAWIPQEWVADPLNPFAGQPCNSDGCTPDGPQNPLLSHCASGTLWESVFAGDNHDGFDGTLDSGADRGEVWASFTTSGSTFTNVGQEVVLGTTHRFEKFNGGSSDCVEAQQASDSGGVAINSAGTELRLTMDTSNPLVPGAPAIHAVVFITVNNGTLTLSYQTTFFPSIGIRVTRGSVQDTDIVNDADCLSQGDVLGGGAATIAQGLADFNNKGTLTVDSNSGSGTIDHPDALFCG
jgi:hypothetical protein